MNLVPTAKSRVIACLKLAAAPLTTPAIVLMTGLDRRDVWTQLVLLHRLGAVRRARGNRPKASRACVRWKLQRSAA